MKFVLEDHYINLNEIVEVKFYTEAPEEPSLHATTMSAFVRCRGDEQFQIYYGEQAKDFMRGVQRLDYFQNLTRGHVDCTIST